MGNADREIWIHAEHKDGRIQDVTLELLGKAGELASACGAVCAAVLLCGSRGSMPDELISHGAARVYLKEDPVFERYHCMPHVELLSRLVRSGQPIAFLFGATALGGHIAARVAADVGTGLSAHCIDLHMDQEGRLRHMVPGFGGNVLATIVCPEHRPQMATVKPGVFRKPERKSSTGEIVEIEMEPRQMPSWPKLLRHRIEEDRGSLSLKEAKVVVAGGWGVGSKQLWALLEKLAGLLRGAVGATRPAVDEGWAEQNQMIGQSGITVKPVLYIGAGISGSMHHMVGIQDSGTIISINNDPKAPIFEMSDLGIVADLERLLPVLLEKIEKKLAGS